MDSCPPLLPLLHNDHRRASIHTGPVLPPYQPWSPADGAVTVFPIAGRMEDKNSSCTVSLLVGRYAGGGGRDHGARSAEPALIGLRLICYGACIRRRDLDLDIYLHFPSIMPTGDSRDGRGGDSMGMKELPSCNASRSHPHLPIRTPITKKEGGMRLPECYQRT